MFSHFLESKKVFGMKKIFDNNRKSFYYTEKDVIL